jgi:hypothetical protein
MLRDFIVPTGFKRLPWNEAKDNQEVYLIGIKDNKPHAYGPYKVYRSDAKILINKADRIFKHYSEDLLVKL